MNFAREETCFELAPILTERLSTSASTQGEEVVNSDKAISLVDNEHVVSRLFSERDFSWYGLPKTAKDRIIKPGLLFRFTIQFRSSFLSTKVQQALFLNMEAQ